MRTDAVGPERQHLESRSLSLPEQRQEVTPLVVVFICIAEVCVRPAGALRPPACTVPWPVPARSRSRVLFSVDLIGRGFMRGGVLDLSSLRAPFAAEFQRTLTPCAAGQP